jgi:phosphohistidine phosphatase
MTPRRLILMRHAKSSWESDAPTDHDRPLNARGRRDAPRVAARLAELGWAPELILSSDAQRTRETCQLLRAALPDPVLPVEFLPTLYLGGVQELRACVRELPDRCRTVLVLGHNPGWEEAASWLSGRQITLKTAGAALLAARGPSWVDTVASSGLWQVEDVIHPRDI